MRPLPEILADLEAAHAMMARALAELVLAAPTDCAGQAPGAATPGSGGLPRTTPDPVHPAGVDIDAVHKPASAPASKVIGGAGSRTVFYDYKGEKVTARQLATLAGCSYDTMFFRLKRHPPAVAVEMGDGSRAANTRWSNAKRAAKAAAAPAPPPPTPKPSVFEYRKPPPPAPAQTSARVSSGFATNTIAPGSKLEASKQPPALDPKAEAIEPPDVKRTVYQPAPKPPVPSTFGRIGEYGETSRWAQVVAEGKP